MDAPRALCRPAFEAIKRGALSWSSKRPSWTVARQGCFTGVVARSPHHATFSRSLCINPTRRKSSTSAAQ